MSFLRMCSLVLLLSSSFFFLLPETSNAALVPCGRSQDDATTTNIDESKPCTACHIIVGGQGVISYGLQIMTYIAIAVIVAMAILYIVSSGNESTMKTAKGGIFAALIGVTVMLSAWLIVSTILSIFSANIPGLQKDANGTFSFSCDTTSNVKTATQTTVTPDTDVTVPVVPTPPPSSFLPFVHKALALTTEGRLIIYGDRYEEFFGENNLNKDNLSVSLTSSTGTVYTIPLTNISKTSITFTVPKDIVLGSYSVSLQNKDKETISTNTVDVTVKTGTNVTTSGGNTGNGTGGGSKGNTTPFSGSCPGFDKTIVIKNENGEIFSTESQAYEVTYSGGPIDSFASRFPHIPGLERMNYHSVAVFPFRVRENITGEGKFELYSYKQGDEADYIGILSDHPCASEDDTVQDVFVSMISSATTVWYNVGPEEKTVSINEYYGQSKKPTLQFGKTYYYTIKRKDRQQLSTRCLDAQETDDYVSWIGRNGQRVTQYCISSSVFNVLWKPDEGQGTGGGTGSGGGGTNNTTISCGWARQEYVDTLPDGTRSCLRDPAIKAQCCPNGTMTTCTPSAGGSTVTGTGCGRVIITGKWAEPVSLGSGWVSATDQMIGAVRPHDVGSQCDPFAGDYEYGVKTSTGMTCSLPSGSCGVGTTCCFSAERFKQRCVQKD
ncbi:MAG: hypothetical protein HYV45_02895 [Candidatus Moranbacteria bacterium]|nr:hypothetical protein [Candidatus Moranbacteria bacterium]